MDSGNIGFVLLCAAFVFVMTPGLAMFYGGLVRKKNVVNTMMTSIFIIGVGIVMWVLFGYSLSFAPSGNAFIGDFRWLGLEGVSLTEGYTDDASIPNMVFSAFQMMFAVITPALITGAVAGRMKFKSIFVFTIFWSLIVYYPLAHMVWGQGGLLGADGIGALDFAGGDVVHISSGVSALVLCILLGKRHDYEHSIYRIHNIPTVVLGASLLMFGWFGFNAGSALAADGLAAHAFMTTGVSAAAAMLSMDALRCYQEQKAYAYRCKHGYGCRSCRYHARCRLCSDVGGSYYRFDNKPRLLYYDFIRQEKIRL